jgi:hypothetical protein
MVTRVVVDRPASEPLALGPSGRMNDPGPILDALDRAAAALAEAATKLTLATLAAGSMALRDDAFILAQAVEAEFAALAATRLRHTR